MGEDQAYQILFSINERIPLFSLIDNQGNNYDRLFFDMQH